MKEFFKNLFTGLGILATFFAVPVFFMCKYPIPTGAVLLSGLILIAAYQLGKSWREKL